MGELYIGACGEGKEKKKPVKTLERLLLGILSKRATVMNRQTPES